MEPENTILELEKGWLNRWIRGDPSGYLQLCSDDVRYYDSYVGGWIDGIEALTEHLEQLRGKILLDSYEIEGPKVLHSADMAILTYVWIGYAGELRARWCAADTYRLKAGAWRIAQGLWASMQRPD